MTNDTKAKKTPASTQQSTRKMIAIIAPNLLGPEDRELDSDSLRTVLATYAAIKRVEDTSLGNSNVSTLEISENFFKYIRYNFQVEHGPIDYGTRVVHDAPNGTVYLRLTSNQFRKYLADYSIFITKALKDTIDHLNSLTEETTTLKPLLQLLETT